LSTCLRSLAASWRQSSASLRNSSASVMPPKVAKQAASVAS
jgi:hypothetical protein